VYEILNEDDNKIYALKELTNIDTVSKQRFEREVKILSELDHPNIVKIFYWNVGGDAPKFAPYYIMEYLGGSSLKDYMAEKFDNDQKYFFDIGWAINTIILPVCNALAQAHSSNVYHRDLKPSNIMFTDETKLAQMSKVNQYFAEFVNPRTCNGMGDLFEFELLPRIYGLYRRDYAKHMGFGGNEETEYDAVLITHAHIDHCAYIHYIRPEIPVYC
jgi:serine/threonine protein kinase